MSSSNCTSPSSPLPTKSSFERTESQHLGAICTNSSDTTRLAAMNLTITGVAGKACASHVMNIDAYADSLQAIESYDPAQNEDCDNDFLCNHLSCPPPNVCWEQDTEDRGFITQISKAETKSGKIYVPLTKLLNQYSQRINASLPEAERSQHPLVFLDHHHDAPIAHPENNEEKPDLVVVPGPITNYHQVEGGTHYSQVPYHKVFSVVNCKPEREEQTRRYCSQLMTARPDMPGVYALWARPRGYQVMWSDASGVVDSPETPWADLELLGAYVYSLYCPPATHLLCDPTVHSPKLVGGMTSKGPRWTIECPNHTYHYSGCETLAIGYPWNRRTHVWKHADERGTVVIKDSYRDYEQPFKEEVLLDKIHGKGIYPGVVRMLHGGDTPGITTATLATGTPQKTPERNKTRLVMGSFGDALSEAESVKEILMVMYDVLEIHRGLYENRRILHRDISSYNILLKPKHHPDTLQSKALAKDRPVFIREVLSPELRGKGEDLSMALLIDFDHGADLDQVSEIITQELASRTGTPMFIARSIASGQLLDSEHATDYVRMPELDDAAKDIYIRAYTKETYEDFCDPPEWFHGCKHPIDKNIFLRLNGKKQRAAMKEMLQQKRETTRFLHRADHDVESIYWVLVIALLRAQPQEVSKDADPEQYYEQWASFSQHIIKKGRKADSRNSVFDRTIHGWEAALDPKLSSLGDMLYAMGKQIRPEYGLLESPKVEHLHEAMRRLLLEQIVEMESDPIPLQRGILRRDQISIHNQCLKRKSASFVYTNKKLKESVSDYGARRSFIAPE